MANDLTGNPWVLDGALAEQTGLKGIRLIQWIDDAGNDIANGDDLVFSLNGATIAMKINDVTALLAVAYEAGPFNPGIRASRFTLTTIDHGALLVWFN